VNWRRRGLAVIAAGLTFAGCASSGNPEGTAESTEGSIPGSPATPGDATRRIVVEGSDDLRFDPNAIEVASGETVTFVVRNVGKTKHEFVLGDTEYQEAHEQEMEEHGHSEETGNVVEVDLTWRFDSPGEVLYGCHEPGHYAGGMVGRVVVGD
jgi:uncharacterized cupredoxin-like copper-binding protein